MKFYICRHCGNIIVKVTDKGVPVICCGEKMEELVAGTVEASAEKHIPDVTVNGNTVEVKVGSVLHPMLPEHFIQWIWLETEKGFQCAKLQPGQEPAATFVLADGDKAVAAYEYCNLHGLWKADI